MLSSVRCGIGGLPPDCEAIVVALGDQPAITTELVRLMITSFSASGKGLVVPMHAGRRGHPLLLAKRYCGEILTAHDRVGLRGLLAAHAEDLLELSVPTSAVLSNMNYPDDYRREVARFAKEKRPFDHADGD